MKKAGDLWDVCQEEYRGPLRLQDQEWRALISEFWASKSWDYISNFLNNKIDQKELFFPFPKELFKAFELCRFEKTKVVIVGQDPYHSFEILNNKIVPHAQGLSFSINREAKKIPPSLRNIFKALEQEIEGFEIPKNGDLSAWSKNGVLLLNSVLTVDSGAAHSHRNIGWEDFSNLVITKISKQKTGIVFLLWGKEAQEKGKLIDRSKHLVIDSVHPSPLSAYRGFFEARCFEKTVEYLGENPFVGSEVERKTREDHRS